VVASAQVASCCAIIVCLGRNWIVYADDLMQILAYQVVEEFAVTRSYTESDGMVFTTNNRALATEHDKCRVEGRSQYSNSV
jgi:hypothetical protein